MVYFYYMRRHKYKRIYSWNPEIAYLVGIFASDGCLSNNGRHLNITSKDTEILENVRTILGLHTKIDTKRNGFGGYGKFIQFSDVALYDFLTAAGLTPAKSKTIARVNVPDFYYGDFLRGVFDGDGTIYGFWDPRWRNSLMYYTGFVSASRTFLEWLRRQNMRIAGTSEGKIKRGTRAEVLNYAKNDSRRLFNLMYHNNQEFCLGRKRDKFVDFLKLDPYPDKALIGRVL